MLVWSWLWISKTPPLGPRPSINREKGRLRLYVSMCQLAVDKIIMGISRNLRHRENTAPGCCGSRKQGCSEAVWRPQWELGRLQVLACGQKTLTQTVRRTSETQRGRNQFKRGFLLQWKWQEMGKERRSPDPVQVGPTGSKRSRSVQAAAWPCTAQLRAPFRTQEPWREREWDIRGSSRAQTSEEEKVERKALGSLTGPSHFGPGNSKPEDRWWSGWSWARGHRAHRSAPESKGCGRAAHAAQIRSPLTLCRRPGSKPHRLSCFH